MELSRFNANRMNVSLAKLAFDSSIKRSSRVAPLRMTPKPHDEPSMRSKEPSPRKP